MSVELQSLALSFENHELSQRCESLHLENENLRTQIQQLRKGSATQKECAKTMTQLVHSNRVYPFLCIDLVSESTANALTG